MNKTGKIKRCRNCFGAMPKYGRKICSSCFQAKRLKEKGLSTEPKEDFFTEEKPDKKSRNQAEEFIRLHGLDAAEKVVACIRY